MNTYLALKLVHIAAAIVGVGTNLTYFYWLRVVRRDPSSSGVVLGGIRAVDARLANPAYVVLPITGVLMVIDGDLGFTTFWIATAIGLYVALGVLAGALFTPALRRQVTLATDGSADGADYARASRRTVATGIVTMIPVAAILYLMVFKPA